MTQDPRTYVDTGVGVSEFGRGPAFRVVLEVVIIMKASHSFYTFTWAEFRAAYLLHCFLLLRDFLVVLTHCWRLLTMKQFNLALEEDDAQEIDYLGMFR